MPRGTPEPYVLSALEWMLERLRHRGPDDQSMTLMHSFDGAPVALGNTRLAIIDPEGGRQPATSEDGKVAAVLNGEIYNYRSLGETLAAKGHVLASKSDTEVLPHLFEEQGSGLLSSLRGMFALAVFDGRTLVLARDRFGIKPLYYVELEGGGLAFASEPLALAPACRLEAEEALLPTFLAQGYVPAPLTTFKRIKKLPAGHVLRFDGERLLCDRYWAPEIGGKEGARDPDELWAAIEESVRAHLVADVEIGMFLSGGIDSSVIAAVVAKATGGSVTAFTVGYRSEREPTAPPYDETARARKVASELGLEHRVVAAREPDIERLRDLASKYGEPIGDDAALATYVVAESAADKLKVVLTGEGGDELFGGYPKYTFLRAAKPFMALYGTGSKVLGRLVARTFSPRRAAKLEGILNADLVEASFLYDEVAVAVDRDRLLDSGVASWPVVRPTLWPDLLDLRTSGALDPKWVAANGEGGIARFLLSSEELAAVAAADFCGFLADGLLHKVDAATMAHGLEARVPYLDHVLFDAVFGRSLFEPWRWGSMGDPDIFTTKPALRALARRLVPVAARGPKRGFSVPLAEWIARFIASEQSSELFSEDRLSRQGYWNPAGVRSAVTRVVGRELATSRRASPHAHRIPWLLLAYQLWLEAIEEANSSWRAWSATKNSRARSVDATGGGLGKSDASSGLGIAYSGDRSQVPSEGTA